jgi:hypothetical protein
VLQGLIRGRKLNDMKESRGLRGSCLCGGVQFEITGRYSAIGQCHCSKCRKVSGAASNAVLYAAAGSLHWTAGENLVREFRLPDGWGPAFCGTCGSPLPKRDSSGKIYYVPAGLLDDDPGVRVERHIFVGSKAPWDEIGGGALQFEDDDPELRR